MPLVVNDSLKTVGLVGTGKLGSAIAQRLIETHHHVYIWNRTRDKAQHLNDRGAVWCNSPIEMTQQVDVVLSILTDAEAIDDVYFGFNGLLTGNNKNKIFVEMSTVRPESQVKLNQRILAKGSRMVESPVGGTSSTALNGQLMAMVGGLDEDIENVRPLLSHLCRRIEHAGPIGAGASLKLAINLPLIVYWQALAEALTLVDHLNIDPARMISILSESSGGPNMLRMKGDAIAQALQEKDTGPAHFTIATLTKDLKAMCEEAKGLGSSLPLVEAALHSFERLSDQPHAVDGIQLPALWLQHFRSQQ